MAFSEVYVDPSIDGDSGAGTAGDPYGDLEYAIEQTTFDTTNGTRVNIKAGTDEVLAADIDTAMADTGTTVAWVPSETAPAIFQGYTSTAGDGGIGGISGGGSVAVFGNSTLDYVNLIDLHMHNTGANVVVTLDDFCHIVNCEIDTSSGGGISLSNSGLIFSCHVHTITGGTAIALGSTTRAIFNFVKTTGTYGIYGIASTGCDVGRNIISVSGSSDGIRIDADNSYIFHNSVWSNAGSGTGIWVTSNGLHPALINNVVSGFSGSGGFGIIESGGSNRSLAVYGGNAVHDCETDYGTLSGFVIHTLGDNETLTSSPFTDPSNDDFSPVNNVKEGSVPITFNDGN